MAKKRDKDKEARKRHLREMLFNDLAAARRVYAAGLAALAEPDEADADAEPGDREPGVRTPVVRLVWDGATLAVPPELGTPRPDQLLGSPLDQLIEVAGRSCYDSLRAARSRNSPDYHQHIRDVRHFSVHEHPTLTFRVRTRGPVRDLLGALVNRVGVWCEYEPGSVIPYEPRIAQMGNPTAAHLPQCEALRLTLNLRAVREWAQVRAPWAALSTDCDRRNGRVLGALMARAAALAAPLAAGDLPGRPEFALPDATDPLFGLPAHPDEDDHIFRWVNSALPACIAVDAVAPASDDEVWVSCHIAGVSRGFCYDGETEVLTADGWKKWPEVQGDELFATVNPSTGGLEYQHATAVTHEAYSGPMYRVASQQVDLFVTPNHRMWVRQADTQAARRNEEQFAVYRAEEILGKRVRYQKGATWDRPATESVTIEPVVRSSSTERKFTRTYPAVTFPAKAFARLLGYYLAEGYLDDGMIVLYQNEGPILDDMVRCIEALGLKPNVRPNGEGPGRAIRFRCVNLHDLLATLGDSAEKKRVPEFAQDWDRDTIRELLLAVIAGDGSVHAENGHRVIYTTSRQMADDFQILAIKAGWSANIRVDDRTGVEPTPRADGRVFKHNWPCYIVSLLTESRLEPHVNHNRTRQVANRWQNDAGDNDQMTDWSGDIHCATVPNGLLLVRRNGKPVVCGNSHEMVRHADWAAISQRSTRYVDESDSDWVPHPLVARRPSLLELFDLLADLGRVAYDHTADDVEAELAAQPATRPSARKQARGAARGLLGNALATRLVYSASLRQWKWILAQRGCEAADGEIRVLACRAYELLAGRWPERFAGWETAPASDGVGYVLLAPPVPQPTFWTPAQAA